MGVGHQSKMSKAYRAIVHCALFESLLVSLNDLYLLRSNQAKTDETNSTIFISKELLTPVKRFGLIVPECALPVGTYGGVDCCRVEI